MPSSQSCGNASNEDDRLNCFCPHFENLDNVHLEYVHRAHCEINGPACVQPFTSTEARSRARAAPWLRRNCCTVSRCCMVSCPRDSGIVNALSRYDSTNAGTATWAQLRLRNRWCHRSALEAKISNGTLHPLGASDPRLVTSSRIQVSVWCNSRTVEVEVSIRDVPTHADQESPAYAFRSIWRSLKFTLSGCKTPRMPVKSVHLRSQ